LRDLTDETKGHDVKKLLMVVLLLAGVVLVVKAIEMMEEWENLSEAEIRANLEEKLAPFVPPDRLAQIQDAIVCKLRQQGKLAADPPPGE